jgi:hypothetical protein
MQNNYAKNERLDFTGVPNALEHQLTMRKGLRSVVFQAIWNTRVFESQHFKPWRSRIPARVYWEEESLRSEIGLITK